jgi:single-strand DNA-binding protein
VASLNQCQFIGNVGKLETRYSASGEAIVNLSLAVNESWKGKDGDKQERTEWVRVSIFSKLAKIASDYVEVGALIFVSGRMQTRKWKDQSGNDRYTTEVICDRLQMLGSKSTNTATDEPRAAPSPQPKTASDDYQRAKDGSHARQSGAVAPGSFHDMTDDIPFADPYRFCWRNV